MQPTDVTRKTQKVNHSTKIALYFPLVLLQPTDSTRIKYHVKSNYLIKSSEYIFFKRHTLLLNQPSLL